MKVTISGQTLTLSPSKMIGEGGEAEVYDIGGRKVAKVFKPPTHVSFRDSKEAQEAARIKLEHHQRKLPGFPKGLPDRIVGPEQLVTDPVTGRVIGYTMPFLSGLESLFALSQRSFREAGFDDGKVVTAFRDLHPTVTSAHSKGYVFGDFNDLNGLVSLDGKKVWMVDADSAQFAGYMCMLFTIKFLDPLCAKPSSDGKTPVLAKPHNEHSDWYAFALMLMQSWLYVGPFGGVYRSPDPAKRISHDMRSLKRITVWDQGVVYPKPARPLKDLPDDVNGYLESVFRHDKREAFPLHLLESLDRKAKGLIPEKIGPVQPGVVHTQVKGMKADRMFQTSGSIMYAVQQKGTLRWLYTQNSQVYREGGEKVMNGDPVRGMRYRISGKSTIIAKDRTVIVLDPSGKSSRYQTDAVSNRPMVDANEDCIFVIPNGNLRRLKGSTMGVVQESIGQLLDGQTVFWVGDDLGFGMYRAGGFCMYFVFAPQGSGINDSVSIPLIKGQLIDAAVAFGSDRIWFFVAIQENGQRLNRCYVIDGKGAVLGSAQATEGDGTWLSTIRGKSASGKLLFVATDDGIVRVDLVGSTPQATKEFPETTQFVDSGSTIIAHRGGIAVVKSREIWNLTMS